MMFSSKTSMGIEISTSSVSAVKLDRTGGVPQLIAYSRSHFNRETIKPSLREPNIIDEESFTSSVKEAVNLVDFRKKRVSVSLPDFSGRVFLLDMESPLKSRSEGVDLIKWKLKKTLPFPVQEVHIDYQTIEEKVTGEISVLVSCISSLVIKQYEDILCSVGLEPFQIDFTSFNLFKLFAPTLKMGERKAFICWYASSLSIFIFHSDKLVFYRTKEIHGERFDMHRVFREISSSLLVYKGKSAGMSLQEVYCFALIEDREAFGSVVAEAVEIDPILLDVSRIVRTDQSNAPDPLTLASYSSAIGAASRVI